MVSNSVPEEPEAGKGRTETGTEEPEAGKGRTETGKGTRDAEVASLQKMALSSAIEGLRRICFVLGISYNKKLLEMGVTSDEDLDLSRVQNQIDDLTKTLEANYKKLKDIGKDLMIEWELSETPFKRMMKFSHVISISDSSSSSAVADEVFLSTARLKRAQKELDGLRNERAKQAKEYEKHRDKLKEMVFENHITWKCVGYDPTIKAKTENYIEETLKIQKSIKTAKDLAVGRKELVFRIELVRQLIYQKELPVHTIRGFLQLATTYVDRISKDARVMYDGKNVSTVLDSLKVAIDALEDVQKKQSEEELKMSRLRPRRGRSPSRSKDPSPGSTTDEADEARDL